MDFKFFNEKIKAQFEKMCKTGMLFRSNISGQVVWDMYLDSFKPKKIFRDPESSENNCNCCKNFIRRYGNIVAVMENGTLESIFTNVLDCEEYTNPSKLCNSILVNNKIESVFFETFDELKSLPYEKCNKTQEFYQLGIAQNFKQYTKEEVDKYGVVKEGIVYTFNHFNLQLPKQFVDFTGKSIGAINGIYKDKYSVFKRAMEEISLDTYILVKDLIKQGSLLDGNTHLPVLEKIITIKTTYDDCPFQNKDNWFWVVTYNMPEAIAKFKNHLIGVLCFELAEGKELNKACEDWNKRVDPANYHKAKAPISEAQKKMAEKFVVENGYIESFNRRLATIDDIKASEILHINRDNAKAASVTIFDNIKTPSGTGHHKRSEFDKVEEVTIDKFMSDILPSCTSIELLLENKMTGNLVNLTTAAENSKQIFKWNNPFSYTFNGNLAGKSMIKEAVKSRGGQTVGDVRISMFFPNTTDDYDLHLNEPNGYHVYYNNRRSKSPCGGMLDLDAQGVDGHQPPEKRVENIIYSDKSTMGNGAYSVCMENYSGCGLHTKFQIEIEIEGDVTLLELKNTLKQNEVVIATIKNNNGNFELSINESMAIIDSKSISKEIWGLDTNKFHKVNLVCLTPNHWGNDNIGNKHYLFMLQGCKNPKNVRGFHNEHLVSELLEHRKVLDVLGSSALIEPTDKQIAGVGFNATVKDEVILKLQGSHKRVIKVNF